MKILPTLGLVFALCGASMGSLLSPGAKPELSRCEVGPKSLSRGRQLAGELLRLTMTHDCDSLRVHFPLRPVGERTAT